VTTKPPLQAAENKRTQIMFRASSKLWEASPFSDCGLEVGESYFTARRVRGKRSAHYRQTTAFGVLKRSGRVYAEAVLDRQEILFGLLFVIA
jgi:hypothetical protein